VQELAWPLGEPPAWNHVISTAHIVDKTGLTGRYDFKIEYAGAHVPGGTLLERAPDGQIAEAPRLWSMRSRGSWV
jgi:Protein of unknown function (DUF3738)